MMSSSPVTTIDPLDKGDETLRRYGFQITYAAIISLSLLDPKSAVEEVFCEQHEDVLVKFSDGKFVGVQVKTKDLGLGAFETNDEQILKSLKRFCCLEKQFPGNFIRYTIVSNAGFYSGEKNHKNLKYLIELAKAEKTSEILKRRSKTKSLIELLAKDTSSTEVEVINVIAKIELRGDAGSLNHLFLDLQERLSKVESLNGQTHGLLKQIADRFIGIHYNASSLSYIPALSEDYILGSEPNEEKLKRIIDGKRIRREVLIEAIETSLTEPISLLTKGISSFYDLPKGEGKLTLKMDNGRISYENVNLQKDNKYAAENHFVSWIHKHGEEKATLQYEQIKLIVQNECQSAYDEVKKEGKDFGTDMLKDVRRRVKSRIATDRRSFFDCKEEHLLGMAAILTEDCKVWWSEKFSIEI